MWLEYFIRGVVTGFVASVFLGPMAVMCIQRTLSKNQRSGFISGLGVATADTFYASLAFFSLTLIKSFIDSNYTIIAIVGSVIVIFIGFNIFFKNPIVQIRRNRTGKSTLWRDYISVFLLTIANPVGFGIFVILFTAFGIQPAMGELNGAGPLVGVFSGAATFWFGLTFAVNLARKKFRPRHLLWMNRISGSIIVLFGLYAILSAFISNLSFDAFLQ
jgi:threonine/homoserine/homoserine lactone efflux protein